MASWPPLLQKSMPPSTDDENKEDSMEQNAVDRPFGISVLARVLGVIRGAEVLQWGNGHHNVTGTLLKVTRHLDIISGRKLNISRRN